MDRVGVRIRVRVRVRVRVRICSRNDAATGVHVPAPCRGLAIANPPSDHRWE